MHRTIALLFPTALGMALALLAVGCGSSPRAAGTAAPGTGIVTVSMAWDTRAGIPAEVARVDLAIEAPDMGAVTGTIRRSDVVAGAATLTLQVQAGENRVARGVAYDDDNLELGRGVSAPFSVVVGTTATPALTLARVPLPAGYRAAIETLTGQDWSVSLPTIEAAAKAGSYTNVMRDPQKVRFTFPENGDDGYVYGTGRVVIATRSPLNSLTQLAAMEAKLNAALTIVGLGNLDRAYAATYLNAVYAQSAGLLQHAFLPLADPDTSYWFDGTLSIPAGGINSIRAVNDGRNDYDTQLRVDGAYHWAQGGDRWTRGVYEFSISSGDHAFEAWVRAKDRTQWFVDVLYSAPPAGTGTPDERRVEVYSTTKRGTTVPCKQISELSL